MTRLSLSPVQLFEESAEAWEGACSTDFSKDDDEEKAYMTSLSYSDDDDDDEEEEEESPHPLGFSSTLGRTKFALDASESMEHYKRRWGYVYPFDDDEDDDQNFEFAAKPQTYPPLSSYLDPQTAPTRALAQYTHCTVRHDTTMDKLATLLQTAAAIAEHDISSSSTALTAIPTTTTAEYFSKAAQKREQHQIAYEMKAERERIQQENQQAAEALMQLLQREEQKAAKILLEEKKRDEQLQKQEEQRAAEEEERQVARDQEKKEKERVLKEKQRKQTARVEEEKRVREEQEKLATQEAEYVVRSKKLIAKLVDVRASVAAFEKSKAVAKRRLGMKKIVNGKVNTLSESVDKIRSVAADVSQAIEAARTEDEQVKKQLQAKAPNVSDEMRLGKRYFVDLLSSKVIVRVQAEGFNG